MPLRPQAYLPTRSTDVRPFDHSQAITPFDPSLPKTFVQVQDVAADDDAIDAAGNSCGASGEDSSSGLEAIFLSEDEDRDSEASKAEGSAVRPAGGGSPRAGSDAGADSAPQSGGTTPRASPTSPLLIAPTLPDGGAPAPVVDLSLPPLPPPVGPAPVPPAPPAPIAPRTRAMNNPDSFVWGPRTSPGAFFLTWTEADKRPPHGSWQALCRYHRLNRDTACTQAMTAAGGKEKTKRLLMLWCLQAHSCTRKIHHANIRARYLEDIPEPILRERVDELPDPPVVLLDDAELDAATAAAAAAPERKGRGRGGRGRGRGRGKPKAAGKAQRIVAKAANAKAKAVPVAELAVAAPPVPAAGSSSSGSSSGSSAPAESKSSSESAGSSSD